MTGLNPTPRIGFNMFQLKKFGLTPLKSFLELYKDQFMVLGFFLFVMIQVFLNIQGSKRVISKTLNKDFRQLSFWLALNIAKTETVLFRTSSKIYDVDVKIKLCRKSIPTSQYAKYLGVFIDETSTGKLL